MLLAWRCSPGTAVGDCLTSLGLVSRRAMAQPMVMNAMAHTKSVMPTVEPSIFAISQVITMGVEPDTMIALS